MDKNKVTELVNNALAEDSTLFLIELSFLPDNKIYVEIDGDNGVSLNECIRVSRAIEHNLDREVEDFSLEVTTPDIGKPIKQTRQFNKNLGRELFVTKISGEKIEGTLIKVNNETIELQWKAREPKPVGKGKVTVIKTEVVTVNEIKESKVKIIF